MLCSTVKIARELRLSVSDDDNNGSIKMMRCGVIEKHHQNKYLGAYFPCSHALPLFSVFIFMLSASEPDRGCTCTAPSLFITRLLLLTSCGSLCPADGYEEAREELQQQSHQSHFI